MKRFFEKYSSAIVALSGGADSAAVLKIAADHMGSQNIVAATCVNHHVFLYEIENARRVADFFNVLWKPFYVLPHEKFLANDELKCYYCKGNLLSELEKYKNINSIDVIFDGTNIDDLTEFRPGLKALEEHNVLSPLKILGFGKKDALKILHGLPFHFNTESCVATRIVKGRIDLDDMFKIEQIENRLREKYPGIRVRVGKEVVVEFKKNLKICHSDVEFFFKIITLFYSDKKIIIKDFGGNSVTQRKF